MRSGDLLKGVVQQLRDHLGDMPTDPDLLTRYVRSRDEAAFTALVRRHGSMVFGVARRQLADVQQAEDVFQATFLALARSAPRLGRQTSLVNWLYTVALRQARKLRIRIARRTSRERARVLPLNVPTDPLEEISGRELVGLIDQELAKLPEQHRLPLLLCTIEGLSLEEAADQLGCSVGAVKGRLERGRKRLAERLARRGLSPSVLVFTPLTGVALPSDLLARTAVLAASPWSTSLPPAVVALAATGGTRRLLLSIALAGPLLLAGLTGLALSLGNRVPPNVLATSSTRVLVDAPVAPAAEGLPLPLGAVRRFGSDRFRVSGWPIASALSLDGTRLAVLSAAQGGRDRVILTVLDAESGVPVCRASVASVGFFASPRLAFSSDGKYVAAAITSEVRPVWASATGELVTKLPTTKSGYNVCQFTPDGLLVETDDKQTNLYEIPSGKIVKRWPTGRIARLTADCRTFVRIEKEFDSISIGDAVTGAVACTLPIKTADNGADNGLAFSADGTKLAVVCDRNKIQIWDVANRKKLEETKIGTNAILANDPHYAISFSPDGQTVVLATKVGIIERWQTSSLSPLPQLNAAWATYLRGVNWSRDGKTISAAASTGLIHRWEAETGKRLPDDGYNGQLHFAISPDGSSLIVAEHPGRLEVWNAATGQVLRQFAKGPDPCESLVCVAVSPDGRRMAVGEGTGGIRLIPLDGGEEEQRILCHVRSKGGLMSSLAWAPDGKALFASGSGSILCKISLNDAKEVWTRSDENLASFALTPDGQFIVKTLKDSIQFADTSTGKPVRNAPVTLSKEQLNQPQPLRACAFAPDGTKFAAAVGADAIALFDRTGRELRRFTATDAARALSFNDSRFGMRPQLHRVAALAFTPDGKWLVSGAEDQAVKVWEAATGKLIMRFEGHDTSAEQVTLAPDGRSAFSSSQDGFVYQWDLTPKSYPRQAQTPDDLWAAVAEPDPAVAVPAAWALVTRSEQLRAFVVDKLPRTKLATAAQFAKWLADLDSPRFADRQAATKALAAQGRAAEPQLRELLRQTKSAEVRQRAEGLIARIEHAYTAEELRAMRIVQACAVSGTPAAHEMLKRWSEGAADTFLIEDAKSALARFSARRLEGADSPQKP